MSITIGSAYNAVTPGAGAKQASRLKPEDLQLLRELRARDREVRAHEQAHALAGGRLAGAPRYTYELGPDGKHYAVGGEVPLSLPPASEDPAKRLDALEQVRSAALAPVNPSSQDRAVAARAAREIREAQADLLAATQAATQEQPQGNESLPADHPLQAYRATETPFNRPGRLLDSLA